MFNIDIYINQYLFKIPRFLTLFFLIYVSVCNRTYYGDVGKTYDLKVNKPVDARLPFLCHLTFTANGQIHGDIVQVRLKSIFVYFFLMSLILFSFWETETSFS